MKIIDLFSGIGGFHKGFEQAGYTFDWVGFSEIDKYASAVYKHKFPKSEELGDITTIQPKRNLPDNIDILCGGFPCQAFSLAGKRLGFDDTRGTLFFEIARILRHYKDSGSPIPCFVLENVKGLLSHDNGRTFATIYGVLSDIGYTIEFQLLNTRWWLPQNRERIYIVGYIGNRGRPQVFPIGFNNKRNNEKQFSSIKTNKNKQTLQNVNGWGGHPSNNSRIDNYKVIDKKGFAKNNQKYASNISGGGNSGGNHSDMDLLQIADYRTDEGLRIRKDNNSPCLTSSSNSKTEPSRMPPLIKAHTTHPRSGNPDQGGTGPLSRSDGSSYCIDTGNAQIIETKSSIRRLTPNETLRLQGFPDNWNKRGRLNGKVVEMSDTQRYKQTGNAVTVNVVQAIAEKIRISSILR